MRKKSMEDIIVDIVIYVIQFVVFISIVYPFYYALVLSFNQGVDATRGGIYIWPRLFTLENYKAVFNNSLLVTGFTVSTVRTVAGTILSLLCTSLFAYTLAFKKLYFRKFYTSLIIISMYFSTGIVPYYLLLKNLGMLNKFSVYIIPSLIFTFYTIIMMTFFNELPEAIQESARIDGANDLLIFFKIIIPISAPIFATIALFIAVQHWNSWFDTAYFTNSRSLKTISYLMMDMNSKVNMNQAKPDSAIASEMGRSGYTAQTIRMATMIVTIAPIVCVYPFLQKYFVKGIMVGSVKG